VKSGVPFILNVFGSLKIINMREALLLISVIIPAKHHGSGTIEFLR